MLMREGRDALAEEKTATVRGGVCSLYITLLLHFFSSRFLKFSPLHLFFLSSRLRLLEDFLAWKKGRDRKTALQYMF